jgi:hypothetical protein
MPRGIGGLCLGSAWSSPAASCWSMAGVDRGRKSVVMDQAGEVG